MNDTYSFFRFALPGIIFFTELFIILAILLWNKLSLLFGQVILSEAGTFKIFIPIITAIPLSVGIGALQSLFYRSIPVFMIDYRCLISSLPSEVTKDLKYYSRSDAWVSASILWFQKATENSIREPATQKSESLANFMHLANASLIGICIILLIWPFVLIHSFELITGVRMVSSIFVLLVLLVLHIIVAVKAHYALKDYTEYFLAHDFSTGNSKK